MLFPYTIGSRATTRALVYLFVLVLAAKASTLPGPQPFTGATRTYFIAADKVWWDYAPLVMNGCAGLPWDDASSVFTATGVGSRYLKAIFREYDGNFTAPKPRDGDDAHLGSLGPLIRAEVGDSIEVHFRNNLDFAVNVEPSGVTFAQGEDNPVDPGNTTTLRWLVTEQAGSAEDETSSKLWMYRSTLDLVSHANAGLIGPILVSRRGSASVDGRPLDVDREFITLFQVSNENESPLLPETLAALNASDSTMGLPPDEFEESNMMHGINGLVFCNLQGLNASLGDRVRWHVAAEGNEVDLHNAHWHGNVFIHRGSHQDQFSLLPGSIVTGDLLIDNPGQWLLHCHVNDHLNAGMIATYTIAGEKNSSYALPGKVLHYYIAAEPVVWDYAPMRLDMCVDGGQELPEGQHDLGGWKRIKAQFMPYTDASFSKRLVRGPEMAYLGQLGPVIRAAVEDTIVIHFLNRLSFNASVHAHGVLYHKDSEGAPYNDGTSGADKMDDLVPPGGTHTYTWFVPERAGPGPADPSSVMWMYHSHSDEVGDTLAGLMGPMIITRKGMATEKFRPTDIDREFVLSLSVFDEGTSKFAEENLERLFGGKQLDEIGPDLEDANKFHGINGFMFCNGPPMQAIQGERVRFYTLSLGTEDGLHSPNLVASALHTQGETRQTLMLLPGSMKTSDAVLSTAGDFLLQCRLNGHQNKGMRALLKVAGKDLAALPASNSTERVFYIAAEQTMWDYNAGATDINRCTNMTYDDGEAVFVSPGKGSPGSRYLKAVYHAYQDASFSNPAPRKPAHGILGPVMYAEVGDYLTVVFKNSLPFPTNIQMGGGLLSPNATQYTDPVPPNATVVYRFLVTENAGPGKDDLSSVAYTYTSSVDAMAHSNAGLVGTYYIARKGALGPRGIPTDVDEVIPLLFTVFDESESALAPLNLPKAESHGRSGHMDDDEDEEDEEAREANLKHSINGFLYCSGPPLLVPQGRPVRYLLVGFGDEVDMHTPVFRNQVLLQSGRPTYTVEVVPAAAITSDMRADSAGTWLYHCNVQDHLKAGMMGLFTVQTVGTVSSLSIPSDLTP